jgi:hypothetical protein
MTDRAGFWTSNAGITVAFATPRKLPKARELQGRVVVLDIAFASESGGSKNAFEQSTLKFIEALGPRLAAWIDHHDSAHHERFASDPRFILTTKAAHGACPELVTPDVVGRTGAVDTIVCHTDFDGLASAAKWLRGGNEPYPGCDDDARAIDTRKGIPSGTAARCDRAIRARPRDEDVLRAILSVLADDLGGSGWEVIEAASEEVRPREEEAGRLSHRYEFATHDLVVIDIERAGRQGAYDKTWLLLLGQEKAPMACVIDGDTATFAAAYDSGIDFLARFGLSGGMPTMVSVNRAHLPNALRALGAEEAFALRYASEPTSTS